MKNTIASFALFFILSFLLLSGCGKHRMAPAYEYDSTKDVIAEYNQELFASASLNPDRSEYLLGPGDLLEIRVLEAEKLNTTARVNSRGFISLPLLDEIHIDGLTASETEQLIEDKFSENYIKDPHVNIFVKEHFSQRVTIVGQVRNPGTYDYPSRQKLLDAIALAGGLTEKASQVVQVRRMSNMAQGSDQKVFVNLEDLIKEGKTDLNISINGGDVIFVPEAGSFFIDGAVRRPGEYFIKEAVSIDEAIITAGGYETYAKTDHVVVMRATDDGQRKEITVPIDKKRQSASPFYMQDRDIVIVDASFWGRFFNGAGINLGIPGMGFTYRPTN